MRRLFQAAALALFVVTLPQADGQEKQKPAPIWKGEIHLGDNPEAYDKITSAGMCMQVPFKADAAKKIRIVITAADVETLAGDGHYAEIVGHYQDGKKTSETIAKVFRIKDDSGQEKDFVFEFSAKTDLKTAPAYFSVRIKVDTSIPFGLWDDFVVKQIRVEQAD
ncbi:MAG TPA: hypothetical protein VE988_23825 [Gemmataceae bacterium]|nr:hypothetical protein [Gemmataceae bacterium]